MAQETPLMEGLVGEGEMTEEAPEEAALPEASAPGGSPYDDAVKAAEAVEMYATDAEAIAETMPAAKGAAATARAAADEVQALLAEVETAKKGLEKVDPVDEVAYATARQALKDAAAPIMEKLVEAKAACEEAKENLPMMQSDESDLAEWASTKIGGGGGGDGNPGAGY